MSVGEDQGGDAYSERGWRGVAKEPKTAQSEQEASCLLRKRDTSILKNIKPVVMFPRHTVAEVRQMTMTYSWRVWRKLGV